MLTFSVRHDIIQLHRGRRDRGECECLLAMANIISKKKGPSGPGERLINISHATMIFFGDLFRFCFFAVGTEKILAFVGYSVHNPLARASLLVHAVNLHCSCPFRFFLGFPFPFCDYSISQVHRLVNTFSKIFEKNFSAYRPGVRLLSTQDRALKSNSLFKIAHQMGNICAILVIFALGSLAPHSRGLVLGLDNGLSSQILEILHSVPPFRVSPLDDFIILIFHRNTIDYMGKFLARSTI